MSILLLLAGGGAGSPEIPVGPISSTLSLSSLAAVAQGDFLHLGTLDVELFLGSQLVLSAIVPVAPPPASLDDRFTYWRRVSQVMPTPVLDSRGRPT